ncbi:MULTISPECIES: biotin--[acetyl-CoA-carboxylase] ligase [Synechococcaceae]|uniref:biotin--[acetyl-CoA-carboxylase] ligase n=1 Tax=Synechococcaceae TaxID=1890426 RepID=UPI00223C19BD|nr:MULTISPECIES: biotin--[acetyl-CoA-carboxylase] ligase [Synechococcaceae]MCT0202626.1 biotin--[acetyl-CoA-carboxylase] ligase [Synechococcus sp. CS-603]MCT4365560.1 biotin--[acetyl-CoA-carboxylase] ligase [Candidatus Regnicoccus frigidus MAG-AL1]MCT4368692.1 biotin--[acetyl-CoA-carboxylase] ligase [Candidatus Regnicoccus frigidus MAG-AL2]
MALSWRLHGLPVCGSTEVVLNQLLAAGASAPLAVFSRRQRYGHGQRGRVWLSPPGGVWLSAALPWPQNPATAADPGLAVAVGLALQLESLGLKAEIKWPNDLLLDGRKLAGLLPRLRLRSGRIRWAQVGLGVNGRNRVPEGAINLAEALGRRCQTSAVEALSARILSALDWAAGHAGDPDGVVIEARQRLHLPPDPLRIRGEPWQAVGLNRDGSLALALGERRLAWHRTF